MGIKRIRTSEFEKIRAEFSHSTDAHGLVAEEMRYSVLLYGEGLRAIKMSICGMDELIQAARLARTKLRRLT